MTDQKDIQNPDPTDTPAEEPRRAFLRGLGKWSQAVIGGILLGSGLAINQPAKARSWINRRGGYRGGGWVNRGGGSGWVNRGGGGAGWINGGGGGWINRRGGGSWINRR